MRRLVVIIFLLCILPLANSLVIEPGSEDTIISRCYGFYDIVIETDGPDIVAISNRDYADEHNMITFPCYHEGQIIKLVNNNNVSVHVRHHTALSGAARIFFYLMIILALLFVTISVYGCM